jgi:hypothetical protein
MSYEKIGRPISATAILPETFRPVPSNLPLTLLDQFERFYRQRLRWVCGSRLRGELLHREYMAWAAATGAVSISQKELRDFVLALGHRRVRSNGIQYCDVAFAVDHPRLCDTLPPDPFGGGGRVGVGSADAIVSRIDRAMAGLIDLRALFAGELRS